MLFCMGVKHGLSCEEDKVWQQGEGVMGRECGMNGKEEKCMQGFGWKAQMKETPWKKRA
jgi:hypothetical protein